MSNKIIFNSDGSVRTQEFCSFINQNSNLKDVFQLTVHGLTVDQYVFQCVFSLPNGESTTLPTTQESGVQVVKLTSNETRYAGALLMRVICFKDNAQLFSYPVALVVNPVGTGSDDTVEVHVNELNQFLGQLSNYQAKWAIQNVRYYLSENMAYKDILELAEGQIVLVKSNDDRIVAKVKVIDAQNEPTLEEIRFEKDTVLQAQVTEEIALRTSQYNAQTLINTTVSEALEDNTDDHAAIRQEIEELDLKGDYDDILGFFDQTPVASVVPAADNTLMTVYPEGTDHPEINLPCKVLQDQSHGLGESVYRFNHTTLLWVYVGGLVPTYSKVEVDAKVQGAKDYTDDEIEAIAPVTVEALVKETIEGIDIPTLTKADVTALYNAFTEGKKAQIQYDDNVYDINSIGKNNEALYVEIQGKTVEYTSLTAVTDVQKKVISYAKAVTISSPATAMNGTLTADELAILQQSKNNFIQWGAKIFRLLMETTADDVLQYVFEGYVSNKFCKKIISVTITTGAWVLKELDTKNLTAGDTLTANDINFLQEIGSHIVYDGNIYDFKKETMETEGGVAVAYLYYSCNVGDIKIKKSSPYTWSFIDTRKPDEYIQIGTLKYRVVKIEYQENGDIDYYYDDTTGE